ncbi:MAG TPA: nucleotidyltransferase [Isosphaeraceae bacterium]|jgi:nucleotidyltransferase/DNA polymerase involved in DNA repair|nr:nucleotidyltransferase [Isosphaeraceae bacterium]
MKTSATAVGHLDADCFYVSAERVRDAFLVGKPVGVLGNQGACVIAKSYEMKKAGVSTAMPIWEAVVKCPNGIYVKRDFRWYEVVSKLMREVVREFSPRVEYYSIDEFFFEAVPQRGKTLHETAELLRARVWDEVRVPVTVGIARTRTLAKLISDGAKPNGVRTVLDAEGEAQILAERPVTEITGIAGRRERRLLPWGIRTCLDLAQADRRLVRKLLTASGEMLWWELNGDPVQPIHVKRPAHKALSRGGSLGGTTDNPSVLFAWLVRNLERMIEELHYYQVLTGRLTVWVAYKNGEMGIGQITLPVPTDRFDLLLDALRPCLRRAWAPGVLASHMNLIAERLTPRAAAPLSLFEPPSDRAERLARVKSEINDRHGRFALRSAATLPLAPVYDDTANNYDIGDIREKIWF